ncbi:MAG: hypothetical protein JSR44_12225, partial [Spirochaetes bacterium]|nr:hypothetical protein [Spirochaetota bacterium]
MQTRSQTAIIAMLLIPLLVACSKTVYEFGDGRLSKGSFRFQKEIYYAGQFEEEESVQKRNLAIVNDLADLDGVGALATRKGLKKDGYYAEYMHRQEVARHGKAAIWFWKQKYKDKFNWDMIFAAEGLKYDEKRFAKEFIDTVRRDKDHREVFVAEFEGKKIRYKDLRHVMTYSDYEQFKNYQEPALISGMHEVVKEWLEKQIHDRVLDSMFADEKELRRFDHNRVGVLYLKVKYGKAGKGIYPGAMDKIKLTPMEIYNHFEKMQNTLAQVLWVDAAYTVVGEDSIAEDIIAKLDKGDDFVKLAQKYALHPQFVQTARRTRIMGYDMTKNIDARENRSYY